MIIIISNRNINPNASDENLFGTGINPKGSNEVRLAQATFNNNQWNLSLVHEDENLTAENLPSRKLFNEIFEGISNKTNKSNWLFHIPGYNSSVRGGLEASLELSQRYNVDVILFSWPAQPSGTPISPDSYERQRQIAKDSANALDQVFAKLHSYIQEFSLTDKNRGLGGLKSKLNFSLLSHSLGNFVVESYIRNPIFSGKVFLFDNIILHQADVDYDIHTEWIDKLILGNRIYVTINRNDGILEVSGANRMLKGGFKNVNNRLGNATKGLNGKSPIYIDFTKGGNVAKSHNLVLDVNNPVITTVFKGLFAGTKPFLDKNNFPFNDKLNAYVLTQG